MKTLKLYFSVKDVENFQMDVSNNDNSFIVTIDLKNDKNYDEINKVNEYLIKNLNNYDEIDFLIKIDETIQKDNEIWKKIFELFKSLWKKEFSDIKRKLNNLLSISKEN